MRPFDCVVFFRWPQPNPRTLSYGIPLRQRNQVAAHRQAVNDRRGSRATERMTFTSERWRLLCLGKLLPLPYSVPFRISLYSCGAYLATGAMPAKRQPHRLPSIPGTIARRCPTSPAAPEHNEKPSNWLSLMAWWPIVSPPARHAVRMCNSMSLQWWDWASPMPAHHCLNTGWAWSVSCGWRGSSGACCVSVRWGYAASPARMSAPRWCRCCARQSFGGADILVCPTSNHARHFLAPLSRARGRGWGWGPPI